MMGNNWINPINKRITELPEETGNSLVRSGKCVMPVAVYYFLSMFLTYGAAFCIGTGQYGAKTSSLFKANPTTIALIIRIIVLFLAVLPMIPFFKKENPILLQNSSTGGRDKPIYFVYTVVIAIALALFLNVMFVKTGLSASSSTYEITSSKQFSLSLGAGLLMYGLCTPIAEEIIYRGLVYNRLRRFFEMPIPLIVAPLLFGVAHGNMVQLIYGFMMGFVICYIYERYGSFVYPVVFHVVANSAVYITFKVDILKHIVFSLPATIITGIVSLIIFILISLDCDTKIE